MHVLCEFRADFMRVLLDENYTHILCTRFKQVYFMHEIFLMCILLDKNYIHILCAFVDSAYYY